MKKNYHITVIVICLILAFTVTPWGSSAAEPSGKLPKRLVTGHFHPPTASVIALMALWENELGIPVIAKQVGATLVGTKQLLEGKLDLYFPLNSPETWAAWNGIGIMSKIGPANVRTLYHCQTGMQGCWTTEKSGIETFQDMAGKRVMCHSARSIAVTTTGYAPLAWAGVLDKIVDFRNTTRSVRLKALAEGGAEMITWTASGSSWPKSKHDIPGLKPIPMSEECGKWIEERVPFAQWAQAPKRWNEDFGQPPQVAGIATASGAMVRTDMDEYLSYRLVKILWDNMDKLIAAHPSWKEYHIEDNSTIRQIMPFHPGAIAYYKEKGIWNDWVQGEQKRLIEEQGTVKWIPIDPTLPKDQWWWEKKK